MPRCNKEEVENVRFYRLTRVASVRVGIVVCEYCERKREIERVTFSLRVGTGLSRHVGDGDGVRPRQW
jgi:hypothetical protein